MSSEANEKLILALPKGRIFKEAAPLFARAGIEPEAAFADPDARQLRFTTNHDDLDIIRVRSFDVATFVAFGAAHLGIAGADVLMEFDYPEIYAPIDLGIGHCRLAVAEPVEMAGGTTYHFVTDGIERALERAKEAADGQDVRLWGGAQVIQQYLAAGLLDELELHVVPVLLGGGARLFDNLDGAGVKLEQVRALEAPGVTHVKYRVAT